MGWWCLYGGREDVYDIIGFYIVIWFWRGRAIERDERGRGEETKGEEVGIYCLRISSVWKWNWRGIYRKGSNGCVCSGRGPL